jgi:hypothetical protein
VSEADVPQWPDELVAARFREEIHARFEAHNAAYREREATELEEVLHKHPDKRGQPGYEVHDSFAWNIYKASEIKIDRNLVTIVLPRDVGIFIKLVQMFDDTSVAWSKPFIGATIVGGEAHPTIEILLVATWNDSLDTARHKERRAGQYRRLVELYPDDIHKLCAILEERALDPLSRLYEIRDWLKLALVEL